MGEAFGVGVVPGLGVGVGFVPFVYFDKNQKFSAPDEVYVLPFTLPVVSISM